MVNRQGACPEKQLPPRRYGDAKIRREPGMPSISVGVKQSCTPAVAAAARNALRRQSGLSVRCEVLTPRPMERRVLHFYM